MGALTEGHLAWGITKDKHAELDAELSDHLHCLQGQEGAKAVAFVRGRINSPLGRRRLIAPHLAEQVAGTLNRWPTRQEWRELSVLLLWVAAILAGDVMALNLVKVAWEQHFSTWGPGVNETAKPFYTFYSCATWLLQAVSRAGFFASFAACLAHAWRQGRGVWLARVLQLKLIHTVLVVGTLFWLGRQLWDYSFNGGSYRLDWPLWLTAPFILFGGLAVAAAILILSQRKAWPWALGCGLAAGFLYCGGPVPLVAYPAQGRIASEKITTENGTTDYVKSTDRHKIFSKGSKLVGRSGVISVDLENNSYTFWHYRPARLTYHISNEEWSAKDGTPSFQEAIQHSKPKWRTKGITTPQSAAGGGLGWLALPIPILGLIGLTGMALVMGRRSRGDAVLYWTLCLVAIFSTILPFTFVGANRFQAMSMFDFGPSGIMQTPTPGFENLLIGQDMFDPWLILFGLLLSAGVPWLVTGLFLRPRKSGLPSQPTEAE